MRIAALLGLAALLACAGSAPDETLYLLRADAPERTARIDPPLRVVLGRVTVAPYLQGAGLVVETGPHEIRPARYHRWAEPLERAAARLLRAQVSRALGYEIGAPTEPLAESDVRVEVWVDVLHGTLEGEARLEAGWRVTRRPGGEEVGTWRLARSTPLARAGYAGLVEAEIALLDDLARGIADSIRGLEARGSAPP